MEFTKDIYFDNNLTNGKNAKITYVGMLYRNGAEQVNLVSGFGDNWDYTSTTPMQKKENGFVAEIEMKDFNTFNFCFSDGNNNWDNNNYANYISPILPNVEELNNPVNFDFEFDSLEKFMNSNEKPVEFNKEIEFGNDYSSSIDDIIEDILGNTVQNSMAEDTESVDDILNSIQEESMPEIEALFNELFFEEQPEEETINANVQDIVTTELPDNSELVKLFNELFNEAEKPIYFENETFNSAAFNLDGLVSDLLDPVINATPMAAKKEESLFDNIEENTITEETSLVTLENDLQVSPRKLGFFYKTKKRLGIACYKLFVKVPKEIAKQLGFNLD